MTFILPIYYALNGAKKMQYIPSQYRVKYLKNILYSRIAVYGGVFSSNWFLFDPYLGKQGGDAGNSSIMSNNLEGFIVNSARIYNLKL